LQFQNGVATGRYEGAQCVAEEKACRVRAAINLASFNQIYAYGDSPDDYAMLRLAHQAIYRWRPWVSV
jgi:phosphatidylglycerophosphatase C